MRDPHREAFRFVIESTHEGTSRWLVIFGSLKRYFRSAAANSHCTRTARSLSLSQPVQLSTSRSPIQALTLYHLLGMKPLDCTVELRLTLA